MLAHLKIVNFGQYLKTQWDWGLPRVLLNLTYTFESPRFYTPLEVSEWIATSAPVFVGMLK